MVAGTGWERTTDFEPSALALASLTFACSLAITSIWPCFAMEIDWAPYCCLAALASFLIDNAWRDRAFERPGNRSLLRTKVRNRQLDPHLYELLHKIVLRIWERASLKSKWMDRDEHGYNVGVEGYSNNDWAMCTGRRLGCELGLGMGLVIRDLCHGLNREGSHSFLQYYFHVYLRWWEIRWKNKTSPRNKSADGQKTTTSKLKINVRFSKTAFQTPYIRHSFVWPTFV